MDSRPDSSPHLGWSCRWDLITHTQLCRSSSDAAGLCPEVTISAQPVPLTVLEVVTNLIFPYSGKGFTPLVPNMLSIDSGGVRRAVACDLMKISNKKAFFEESLIYLIARSGQLCTNFIILSYLRLKTGTEWARRSCSPEQAVWCTRSLGPGNPTRLGRFISFSQSHLQLPHVKTNRRPTGRLNQREDNLLYFFWDLLFQHSRCVVKKGLYCECQCLWIAQAETIQLSEVNLCYRSANFSRVLEPPRGGPETQLNRISRELERAMGKELIEKSTRNGKTEAILRTAVLHLPALPGQIQLLGMMRLAAVAGVLLGGGGGEEEKVAGVIAPCSAAHQEAAGVNAVPQKQRRPTDAEREKSRVADVTVPSASGRRPDPKFREAKRSLAPDLVACWIRPRDCTSKQPALLIVFVCVTNILNASLLDGIHWRADPILAYHHSDKKTWYKGKSLTQVPPEYSRNKVAMPEESIHVQTSSAEMGKCWYSFRLCHVFLRPSGMSGRCSKRTIREDFDHSSPFTPRYRGRKTKAYLDLNVVRDKKGSKRSFYRSISSKKTISENVGLLLNRAGNLGTKDTEKAEVSHILFNSVFTSKVDIKKSQVPETHGRRGTLPVVEDDRGNIYTNRTHTMGPVWRNGQKGFSMKFNKWKCKVLQLQRNGPMHQCMLGADQLGRSLAEKGLGVLLDTKLTMNQQRRPTASSAALG
ncbi:hypothetical protein QYF61_002135 [Mycteria americana]|uniref:Uncharacterized protein n=1 Tax=Mycteria americana TaxID=33587 RepID=A0AAN7NI38_MYCAM|nr:hypothetical protein QYF61_002135 [Mycteria americana]